MGLETCFSQPADRLRRAWTRRQGLGLTNDLPIAEPLKTSPAGLQAHSGRQGWLVSNQERLLIAALPGFFVITRLAGARPR